MRMAPERMEACRGLAEELKSRPARKRDQELIDELIQDETESRQKSLGRIATVNLGPSQKKAQESGAANCAEVIKHLKVARRSLKDPEAAVVALEAAAEVRAKKSRSGVGSGGLWNRYTEYLIHTDQDFQDWMKKHGHTAELATLKKEVSDGAKVRGAV